jgi:polar amino acid transport system permease protein
MGETTQDTGLRAMTDISFDPWHRQLASLLARWWTPLLLCCLVAAAAIVADSYARVVYPGTPGVIAALIKWTPLILFGPPGQMGGFVLNIFISLLSMTIGTVTGILLGIAQISPRPSIKYPAFLATQFFRNSPWLVLLYFAMFLLPFELRIFGIAMPFPDWIKATIGLALPVMANISEVTRGAIQSIPTAQWEATMSLGLSGRQTLALVILPQCVRRAMPLWMNWYAILMMSTPLVSIVGVNDAMTLVQDALASEQRSELLVPIYLWLLFWFGLYCYPIARCTQLIERRFAVGT